MARVLLLGLGSSGDLNPLLGLAAAFGERGHETVLLSAPPFRTAAEAVGARFVALGSADAYDRVYADPDLWHPRKGLGVFFPYVAGLSSEMAEAIEAEHRPGETVAVATFQCFGARVAQDAIGVPVCTVLPNPILLQSVHDPGRNPVGNPPAWMGRTGARIMYRIVNSQVSRHARRGVNRALTARGLDPVRDVVGWSRSPDLVLGLWPALLAAPQSDWPPQAKTAGFIAYDGAEAARWTPPADLPDRGDWIVFTPGTQMTHGAEFFHAAVAACGALGAPGLMVTRDRSLLPAVLPPGVHHLPWAPFGHLFRRAAAVVHHGGIGTAGRALEAGVPQLIVPRGFDQLDNAARVERIGGGRELARERLSVETLTASLRALVDDDAVRGSCRAIRRRLARVDAVADTCSAVERLLARA